MTSFPRDRVYVVVSAIEKNMSAGGGGAFGAGMAGAPFDPVQFIKKPQVILRIASTVCYVTLKV